MQKEKIKEEAGGNGNDSHQEALRWGRFFNNYGKSIDRILIFILFVALVTYALLAFLLPIEDNDFWWHLKSGQFIMEQKSLPASDPFAFPHPSSQTAREVFLLSSYWLAQIAYYLVHLAGGFKGLVFLRVCCLSFMFGMVFLRMMRQRVDPGISLLFLAASLMIFSSLFYGDRPQVFSFIGAGILVGMMEKIRDGGRPSYLLFPVMAIWSNLHGGFTIGVIFLALFAAGSIIQYRRDLRQCITPVLWSLGGIIASLVNPNGFRALLFSLQLGREDIMTQFVDEYQSTFAVFSAGHYSVVLFWGMIILGCSGIVIKRKLFWPDICLLAFTAAISVAYVRNIPFFSVALAPLSAHYFDYAVKKWGRTGIIITGKGAAVVLMVGVMGFSAMGFLQRGSPLQQEVGRTVPIHAADFMENAGIRGRMFNDYDWGGYLIWRLYPRVQDFIDGRLVHPSLIQEYGKIIWGVADERTGLPMYRTLFESYGVDLVVQRPYMAFGNLLPLMGQLINDPDWIPVYIDREAFVFIRNNELNREALQKYQISRGDFSNRLLENLVELIREHPEDYRFYLAAGEMLVQLGRISEAERFLSRARELSPGDFFVERVLSRIRQ